MKLLFFNLIIEIVFGFGKRHLFDVFGMCGSYSDHDSARACWKRKIMCVARNGFCGWGIEG